MLRGDLIKKLHPSKPFAGVLLIAIILLSGCVENISNDVPDQFIDSVNQVKDTVQKGFDDVKEFVFNDDIIYSVASLEPIDDKSIDSFEYIHSFSENTNLLINILNTEAGLDLDHLHREEYEKLSKLITEYTPLLDNYNKIVIAAQEYENGNIDSKKDFYHAVAEFSLELMLIQGVVFYKPAYKITGIIYRNSGLTRLAFKCPSIVSHLLSSIHWYFRNLMIDSSSDIAGFYIDELNFLDKFIHD